MQYHINKKLIKEILKPYDDTFIYLHSDGISYDSEHKLLRGQITYQGSHFLKNALDHKIFNSGDAILAINQIGLVLLLAATLSNHNKHITQEVMEALIMENIALVYHVVVMKQMIEFKKMINTHLSAFPFEAKIKNMRKSKKGEFFILDMTIGPDNNFSGSCTGLIFKEDPH